ncbi:MAG TPA: MFS transporter [Acidimicrobiales bacterium]|nr:MFS transporter [Acidimicrobiales bacterium]
MRRVTGEVTRTDGGGPARAPHGVRTLLRHTAFRRLLIGQSVSALGDWMATVALLALVLDLTGSSTAVAGILVLRLAPAALAGPLAARAIRRWDRRRTMVAMDGARAGIVVLVPLVHAVWWVFVWAFVLEVAGLVFLPARDAAIPDLTHFDDLPLANGLVLGSSYGTLPLGAGAFVLFSAVLGGHAARSPQMLAVFSLDALTFLVSLAMILPITELRGRPAAGAQEGAGTETDEPPRLRFRDAFRLPLLRAVGPATFLAALGIGSLFSLGIVFVRNVLGASNAEFGVLVILFGAGAALGLAVLEWSGASGTDVVFGCVAAQGAVIAVMSLAPGIGAAFLGAAGFGASTAAALAAAMTVLQQRLTDRDRVVAFAAFHVLIRVGLAMSALGAGVAADVIGRVRWPVVGTLPPARVVLFGAGAAVLVSSVVGRQATASLIAGDAGTSPTTSPPPGASSPAAT